MAIVSISQAAKLVRKGRQTLYNHNDKGKLSFTKTEDGKPGIDTSELERVYGKLYMPADQIETVVKENETRPDKLGQREWVNSDSIGTMQTKLSRTDPANVDTVSTVSWFIEQVDATKQELADAKDALAKRDQTLAELRSAMAILPSPESVEQRLAEQANQLEQQHNQILEAEREQLAQVLAEQRQQATRESRQWQESIADRKREIQQARAEADALKQREAEQAAKLNAERARVVALESRGLIARLLNKKSSPVV